jgi:3-hydroxybutyryl-CoA dehydrogenase
MEIKDIKKVLILGAGTMGQQIGLLCAMHGYNVTINDIMNRITASSDAKAAAKDTDIISESVPEDPKIKSNVLALFNELCPKRTIFTTNTSLLMPIGPFMPVKKQDSSLTINPALRIARPIFN